MISFVSKIIPIYDVTFSNAILCSSKGSYVKTNNTVRFLSRNWSRSRRHFFGHLKKSKKSPDLDLNFAEKLYKWPHTTKQT